jgi:hypothetical protein
MDYGCQHEFCSCFCFWEPQITLWRPITLPRLNACWTKLMFELFASPEWLHPHKAAEMQIEGSLSPAQFTHLRQI